MTVDLIDHMGDDLTVVNAARVSFDKESEWEGIPFAGEMKGVLQDKDIKLINYLAKHNHWTPFAHCSAQFRIKAPVFVARQLIKHQVGLVWNEVSRRYVDSEPEFWKPDMWRATATDKKQGSSSEGIASQHLADDMLKYAHHHALEVYKNLLGLGVCPEQARAVLPQSMLTEWYWSGTMAAFARVCKLRNKPDAQLETQHVAKEIEDHMLKLFPVSWAALCGK